jgi:hypothetical protein
MFSLETIHSSGIRTDVLPFLVRIQKPVVTYDLGKFSVTNCARLPNYFQIYLLYNFNSF